MGLYSKYALPGYNRIHDVGRVSAMEFLEWLKKVFCEIKKRDFVDPNKSER
jgi:hypothetical protein